MTKTLEKYEQRCVMQFLMGLNESFAPVRGQILFMDPMPPINKVFSLIRQEERQRSIGSMNGSLNNFFVESTALLCKTKGPMVLLLLLLLANSFIKRRRDHSVLIVGCLVIQ
jgi:hypothetical protein